MKVLLPLKDYKNLGVFFLLMVELRCLKKIFLEKLTPKMLPQEVPFASPMISPMFPSQLHLILLMKFLSHPLTLTIFVPLMLCVCYTCMYVGMCVYLNNMSV